MINDKIESSSILIVDDIPQNLQLIGNLLKSEGYQLTFATSGEKALALMENLDPDLILLDIMLPNKSGIEICKILKSEQKTLNIPVIFLTAKSETANMIEGFSAGAVDYVTKPFKAAVLLARVKTHIELKKARDKEKKLIQELQEALANIKRLKGLLPICANCKKIRDDEGYWQRVDEYIMDHADVQFTHGICPECKVLLYPELFKDKNNTI